MSDVIYVTNTPVMERVHYFPRQLITADDMRAEQEYFRQKMRRHNRFLHGWGVVCGLMVTAAPSADKPWQVQVAEGYALSPQGDEIYVPEAVCLDLAKCGFAAQPHPCEPGVMVVPQRRGKKNILYIAVRYVECPSRPVRIHPAGCGCDETGCEYSRIRDDYDLSCMDELPATHRTITRGRSMCEFIKDGITPACPPCPEDPWVVLAAVNYPTNMSTPLTDDMINNRARRELFSTAVIQEQVVECCCNQKG